MVSGFSSGSNGPSSPDCHSGLHCRVNLWLFLVILCSAGVRAEPWDLTSEELPAGPGEHWYYTDQLPIDADVIAAQASLTTHGWRPVMATTPNFGLSANPYWFTFELRSARELSLIAEISYALLDRIDFYILEDGRVSQSYHTGDKWPFHQRPVEHRHFLFPVELPAEKTLRVFFRVKTSGSIQVPVTLWDSEKHRYVDQRTLAVHAFLVAIVLTIGIYNLMLFISSRDWVFLFYTGYVFSIAMTQMALRGLSYQFFWRDFPYWNEINLIFFAGTAIATGTLFVQRFLKLVLLSRIVYQCSLALLLLGVLVMGSAFVLEYSSAVRFAIYATNLGCLAVMWFGIYSWMKGNRAGMFLIVAWSFFLMGIFISLLAKLGLVPRTTFLEYSPQVGAAIEVILLSFAIADRMNEERRKRMVLQEQALENEIKLRAAQEHALELQTNANQKLEENVRSRTMELQEALEELSTANAKLKVLNTIDGLTQVRNRRYFDEVLATEWARAMRSGQPLALIILDADHFKKVNDTYGHLAGDECLKSLARVMEQQILRPSDCLARYGGEEFAIILANTPGEGALKVAERLRTAVESKPVDAEGVSIRLTISLGVGVGIPQPGQHFEDLIAAADKALYMAKEAGRNRVEKVDLDLNPITEL